MGNPASKVGQEICEEELTEGSVPSTPILTPKTKMIDMDPRSPSTNVIRTPIEVLFSAEKVSLDGSVDSLNNEYSKDTLNVNLPDTRLIDIDPRSPTTDFTRTPIVIANNKKSLPVKLHNKNLDNVRKTLIVYTPTKTTHNAQVKNRIPPKLLKSSPIVAKPNDTKRKSYVGLLETNLDYVETDLDTVRLSSTPNKQTSNTCSFESNCESDDVLSVKSLHYEILDPRSPTTDFVRTPLRTIKKKSEISFDKCLTPKGSFEEAVKDGVGSKNIIDICKCEDVDPRSPTTDFIRTPLQILKKIGEIDLNDNKDEISSISENVIDVQENEIRKDFDDDGLKLLHHAPVKVNASPAIDNTPSQGCDEFIVAVDNVTDFDKKLTNLIYEDKDVETIVKNKANREIKNRMPLGIYNSNGNPRKSIPKLKVSDKPRKNEKDLSKIPIFKERKPKLKLGQQCENTPPKNIGDVRNAKAKKSQWDPDNTLII